ncbi:LamG domain protein [Candidatus Mancarchaeum acidiphilum]|uniref:LamG domain protein n=1 Tax=Candidatus Mancarchaeum acidiphilum TaxID=1920749 RepID=A0A218NM26_9ARCH|nr:LamG-like jellyroll fold domain-containing protein [Candidatus Mancarchaeum acidiphilum]ASI13511.1 LamG domain protein [Candidatus Mancarchaeum acidiphilum]
MTNKKGFIFTLDAVFALIVAAAAISILLYIHFIAPISYQSSISQVEDDLQVLTSTPLGGYLSALDNPFSGYTRSYNTFGAASFDGYNSYISSQLSVPAAENLTYVAWIYLNYIPDNNAGIISAVSSYNYGSMSIFLNGNCNIQVLVTNNTGNTFADDSPYCLKPHRWYQVVATENESISQDGKVIGGNYTLYINGEWNLTQKFSGALEGATGFNIGLFSYQGAYFPGYISNVQIYGSRLTRTQVSSLYDEGTMGIPLRSSNLLEWYPLNSESNPNVFKSYNVTYFNTGDISIGNVNLTENQSMLSAIADLYLNDQAPEADIIMDNLYHNEDTGIYINSTYAPDLKVAYFDGTAGFYAPNFTYPGKNYTINQWFYLSQADDPTSGVGGGQSPIVDIYNGSANGGIGGSQNLDFGGTWAGGSSNNFGIGEDWPSDWEFCSTNAGTVFPNKWYNAVVSVVNYTNVTIYLNGVEAKNCLLTVPISGMEYPTLGIGDNPPGGNELATAAISNVQVYDSAVNANQAVTLYDEGIAGEPVSSSVIGWYPLLGNFNDYSGIGHSGFGGNGGSLNPDNVRFIESNFTPPGFASSDIISQASSPELLNVNGTMNVYNVSVLSWG